MSDPRPVLVEHPHRVVASDDCGGYFCEHMYFVGRARALERGGRMGFLHVPADDEAFDLAERARPNLERQRHNRVVVGAILRAAVASSAGPETRVLLTGFGPFKTVVDNPSGAFVADRANVDQLVVETFPDAERLGHAGDFPLVEGGRARSAFLVAGGHRLVLATALLPVDERALNDGSGTAIGELITWSEPALVLALGVASFERDLWRIETRASDRGLVVVDGRFAHEKERPSTVHHDDGAFLGELLWEGLRPLLA